LLFAAAGGTLGRIDVGRLALVPVALLAALPFGPLGEELGWRGFALPRLVKRYGAISASIIVGLVWTLWHTPLFWAPAGTSISGGPVTVSAVAAYAGVLIGNSFLYTWVLAHTRASLLMAVLIHAGFNADVVLLPFTALPDAAKSANLYFGLFPIFLMVALLAPRLRGMRTLES
jgi:membrane protease YdiL (CAAX protease family)